MFGAIAARLEGAAGQKASNSVCQSVKTEGRGGEETFRFRHTSHWKRLPIDRLPAPDYDDPTLSAGEASPKG